MYVCNPTFLYTDASRKGIGAVLKQADTNDPNGPRYPVGYFSRSLLAHQRNYSVTELELLAIVSAVDYWSYYLIGVFFVIITDHLPLKSVHKISRVGSRLFNWAAILKQYQFRVEYLAGENNGEADYLSRHPIELLEEATQSQVFWIDENRVQEAQNKCEI